MTAATLAMQMATSADRSIVISRVIQAPRELVFKAWTDPAHIALWFGPRGFTTTTSEINARPGGIWRFVMHGPDRTGYRNRIVYTDIVRPEKLAYAHTSDDDKVIREVAAIEGGHQTIDRLEEYLQGQRQGAAS